MSVTVLNGDSIEMLRTLPAQSAHTCITSPPYFGLRDYQVEGQIGLEETPDAYVQRLVEVFREVRRVLRDDGTVWLNLGDSMVGSASTGAPGKETAYTGKRRLPTKGGQYLKPKDLIGIPWRVAFALQADGWYLRSDIIWHKPNVMPESVRDRPTKSHEYIFLLSKHPSYYYDADAIKEPMSEGSAERYKYAFGGSKNEHLKATDKPTAVVGNRNETAGRNKRTVWTVTSKPFKGAHFACFPPDLIRPCVLAGAPEGGVVLDPFAGSGTTLQVALEHGREAIGIELNPDYIPLIEQRLSQVQPRLAA